MREFGKAVVDGWEFTQPNSVPELSAAIHFDVREVIIGVYEFCQAAEDGCDAAMVGCAEQETRERLYL